MPTETLTKTTVLYMKDGKSHKKSFLRASQAAIFIANEPSAYERHTETTVIEMLTPAAGVIAE
jgi:hypothetical protein